MLSQRSNRHSVSSGLRKEVIRMRVIVNRVPELFAQVEEYWFHGPQTKLARDAGVSKSQISRILHSQPNPSYYCICRIVTVLEQKLGVKLDPREVYQVEP
jgi:transcriptional regulator with XRE-family HTH domain